MACSKQLYHVVARGIAVLAIVHFGKSPLPTFIADRKYDSITRFNLVVAAESG